MFFGKFFPHRKLTGYELTLIPESLFRLVAEKLKVTLLPAKRYLRKDFYVQDVADDEHNDNRSIIIAGVINGMVARLPWESSCLVKAMAAHRMLKRRHIAHKVHIGVGNNSGDSISAHAWLSSGDRIIIGDKNLDRFHEVFPESKRS